MDPLTQAALGSALPLALRRRRGQMLAAGLCGALGGMVADLDVLIRSDTDPLLFLDYHRQFSHALVLAPVAALLGALALQPAARRLWPGWTLSLRASFLCALPGAFAHLLLDTATSYGTMLFWPFSEERVALAIVSIVDPLLTLPLLAAVVAALWRRRPGPALAGLAWVGLYLAFAALQQQAARTAMLEAAAARGHEAMRAVVKPSFANQIVWRTVYETADGRFHVDAVRVRPGAAPRLIPGASLPRLEAGRDLPWLDPESRQAGDVERFRRFSDGYVARDPGHPHRVIDVRYSFLPQRLAPLWSIELDPGAPGDAHARYRTHRAAAGDRLGALWRLVRGAENRSG